MPIGKMVGAKIKRREDPRLITGNARYTDDIQQVGQLYMALVRSPHAHATIKNIKTEVARKQPGVRTVITGAEIKANTTTLPVLMLGPFPIPEHYAMAVDKVCYVGNIVAAVIAESRGKASDAADLVEVEYEMLPAVVDVEEAAKGLPVQIHPNIENNIGMMLEFGTDAAVVKEAFDKAEVVVEGRFPHQRLAPNPMETRNVAVQWQAGEEQLTVYSSTQVPHALRAMLSEVLSLDEHMIRVVAPEIGGGFGCKVSCYAEDVIACYAARKLSASVKWSETRSENLMATSHGRAQIDYVRVAATKEGRITALDVTAYTDMGAYYTRNTPLIPVFTALMVNGVYDIPACHYKTYNVITNKTPSDAYRGAGRPEATYLGERIVSMLAAELGLDPLEVRRQNFIAPDKFPYATPFGLFYDSGEYAANMDKAMEIFDYAGMRKMQEEARGQGRYVGIGVSTYVEICGVGPSIAFPTGRCYEVATLRFEPSGKVTVFTGLSPHGQGNETVFAQIVADEFNIPMKNVVVKHGDTENTPSGTGTFGSRGLALGGSALLLAVDTVKEKAKKIAAYMMEANADDITMEDGAFSVKGSPGKSLTIMEVVKQAYTGAAMFHTIEPGLEATRYFEASNYVFPFGTHLCAVEVDPETGDTHILKYVAVDDCGVQANPLIVEGQVHGGIAQGIAEALYEEIVYDENGQLITGTLMDYTVPTATEIPTFQLDSTVTPTNANPLGAKGIGEAGSIGSTPAVVNAVVDALSPKGVKNIDMPLRPEKLWKLINRG